MSDRMILIAIINSRSEAMVVTSLLDAAGVLVHVGGYNHASVSINPLALGGFRIMVPQIQYQDASQIISETPGYGDNSFSYGLQRAVFKFLAIWLFVFGLPYALTIYAQDEGVVSDLIVVPLSILMVPVNPQGNSEYWLYKLAKN